MRGRDHLRLGEVGEMCAARYLEGLGMRIVERRVRFRRGELDIVARDGKEWVFVEVKTRTGERMGAASEAFTFRKMGRFARAAREYIALHSLYDQAIRYDLVAVDIDGGGQPRITHYPNAGAIG